MAKRTAGHSTGRDMGKSFTSVGAITLFVDDPARSREFYERVFDLAPIHQDDDAATFKFQPC
ncbi:MAG: VOC family protein [Candidatus Limnocylindrales bacterium]